MLKSIRDYRIAQLDREIVTGKGPATRYHAAPGSIYWP